MAAPLKVLDLFSGIGGFSLGLERTGGFQTVAFCEIEPYPQAVLSSNWKVPIYDDIRQLTAAGLRADGIECEVITAGFPCQDITNAGTKEGITGSRSSLFKEVIRLAADLQPDWIILENVAALLARGLGDVLRELASIGYAAEWECIPASILGAPHERDRWWCVAFPDPSGQRAETGLASEAAGEGRYPSIFDHFHNEASRETTRRALEWWSTEPDVGRLVHGVPYRVDRIKALGNSVVPFIPELIGRAILQASPCRC